MAALLSLIIQIHDENRATRDSLVEKPMSSSKKLRIAAKDASQIFQRRELPSASPAGRSVGFVAFYFAYLRTRARARLEKSKNALSRAILILR